MRGILTIVFLLVSGLNLQAQATKPNIIVILSDDMGFSDLGCYGGEIKTPNLDKLAANGLRFNQFYNTARCCPTRASLLTGLYPHQAGVGHMVYETPLAGYKGDLNKNTPTIAEILAPAGYKNYAVGKWHVTRYTTENASRHNWPMQRGFHRYYGTLQGGGSFYDPYTLTRDNTPISAYADPEYKPAKFYYTDAISDNAVKFVNEHKREQADKPFFMYVAYTAAHWPMHALDEDVAKYKGIYDQGYDPIRKARFERSKALGVISPDSKLTPTVGDWSKVENKEWETRCMEVYAAMVDRMDQGIGKIVKSLETNGLQENTLIFYMQDNGGCAESTGRTGNKDHPEEARAKTPKLPPVPLDYRLPAMIPKSTRDGFPVLMGKKIMPGGPDTFIAYGEGWANVSNTPFREYKHWVHEGGISTPLIACWPKGIMSKGEIRNHPGHLVDIAATCADLAGVNLPEKHQGETTVPLAGKSLKPAFNNQAIERDAIYWEHEGNRAIRVGDKKLVAKGSKGTWELYDLKTDRAEAKNLAGENPELVKTMSKQWNDWAYKAKVLPWIWDKEEYSKKGNKKK